MGNERRKYFLPSPACLCSHTQHRFQPCWTPNQSKLNWKHRCNHSGNSTKAKTSFVNLTCLKSRYWLAFFRWFKFTLKPPYSITCGKLRLAIWDTSFWTFFAQIWTQGTLRHILGPILVIFEICQFLMIPGPFEYFLENGWSQKIKVFSMKEWSLPPYQFSFRRRGP